MLNIYISEFLPLSGIGFCIAGQWIASGWTSYALPKLMEAITIPFTFVVCAAFSVIHIVVLNWMGVETLDKGKYEIEKEFQGKKDSTEEDHKPDSNQNHSLKKETKL